MKLSILLRWLQGKKRLTLVKCDDSSRASTPPQLSDAGDELVLEAAINGYADAIVSFNQKDYKRDHQIVPERFGIKLMLPNEAVRKLRNSTQ